MTTNKPEVSVIYDLASNETKKMVLLDDYEALQAECEKLVEALREIATWPDGGSTYGQEKIKAFASAALAAHHKGVKP